MGDSSRPEFDFATNWTLAFRGDRAARAATNITAAAAPPTRGEGAIKKISLKQPHARYFITCNLIDPVLRSHQSRETLAG
jgi:hypothetical protein